MPKLSDIMEEIISVIKADIREHRYDMPFVLTKGIIDRWQHKAEPLITYLTRERRLKIQHYIDKMLTGKSITMDNEKLNEWFAKLRIM